MAIFEWRLNYDNVIEMLVCIPLLHFFSFQFHLFLFSRTFLLFFLIPTSFILLNSNRTLINLSYWMEIKKNNNNHKKIVGIKKNTLFYFCVFSIFQTVSIDQNVICFVPFYIMYVFFLTLHIKFAYSTYRIALRYLNLNESLRNSKMYRKLRP